MKRLTTLFAIISTCLVVAQAQDTFSIVAVDSATGQVGSAGASCISADNLELYFPNDDPDFLGDLLPGLGAINSQASYLPGNQDNANEQLSLGNTPQQVVDWLAANDVQGNSGVRQYGVAALINGQPMAAGFTGANCFDYKNHRVGPNYSIQGNILLGVEILDSMEARYLAAEAAGKCLAERLMEAMQGAKVPGADTRCLSNGTSAMFAFIKVARPDDDAADPMLRLFVSYNPLGIEPIDSLQAKFDEAAPCFISFTKEKNRDFQFQISPNPTSGAFELQFAGAMPAGLRLEVFDATGELQLQQADVSMGQQFFMKNPGVYFVRLTAQDGKTGWGKLVVGR
ncbi:MAG: DUF1028 domain-containing protein [Saprospiraceae bacterium]|nr:DUF1028 domain-containing protein [Saprospiraceae bacterium]MCF8282133.1 DUF1028 domain-containing protein [Bacteroidales bacterium]